MQLNTITTTILGSIVIIGLFGYQLNSYFDIKLEYYSPYQDYERKWDDSWNAKLKKLSPVKRINHLEYTKLSRKEILFIERFLEEELVNYNHMFRSRGLVQSLLDQYCHNVDIPSCGNYLNRYLNRAANYRLAGRYVSSLNEDSLTKSIKGSLIPDRFYFALNKVEGSPAKLKNFSDDWRMYLTFLLNKFNPEIKFRFHANGNIVILNTGILVIPPALDVVVNLIKFADIIQCDFDCSFETNEINGTVRVKRISKTYFSMNKSKEIKIKVEDGSVLEILPWLGKYGVI